MEYNSHSADETKKIGAKFAEKLVPPATIALFGDLGSGKTTFVQGMARGLEIDPRAYVNSPTFTIVNEYGRLIHIDLYRIEPSEVESLALEEYLALGNIVVIEWAEKARQKFDFEVRFETVSDRERNIVICPMT